MSVARRVMLAVLTYAFGGLGLALAWSAFAPRASCYAPEGLCVFFAGEMSNIFFEIDAWFAGIALALGVLFAFTHRRWWLARGFRYQLAGAVLAIASSYAAAKGIELLNPLHVPASGDTNFRDNVISLGTPSALLMWAFSQQLVFALTTPQN